MTNKPLILLLATTLGMLHAAGTLPLDAVACSGLALTSPLVQESRITLTTDGGDLATSVHMLRDEQDRVSAVYEPVAEGEQWSSRPPVVRYHYDGNGNLVTVERRQSWVAGEEPVYEQVGYRYENTRYPHHITGIAGPDGQMLQTEN